jgi:hypothetical protein
MKNKTNKSKPKMGPLGTPLGNPLAYFRSENSKKQAMYSKGGYKVPNNRLRKYQITGEVTPGSSNNTSDAPISSPLSIGVPVGQNTVIGGTTNLGTNGISNTNLGINYDNQKGTSGSVGYNLDKNQVSGQGNVGKWSGNASYDFDDQKINANVSRKVGDNWDVGVGYSGDVNDPSLQNVNVNAKGKILGVPVKISAGTQGGLKFGSNKKGGSLKKVPAGKVGLYKLPTSVRNKMGYMKKGGSKKR